MFPLKPIKLLIEAKLGTQFRYVLCQSFNQTFRVRYRSPRVILHDQSVSFYFNCHLSDHYVFLNRLVSDIACDNAVIELVFWCPFGLLAFQSRLFYFIIQLLGL